MWVSDFNQLVLSGIISKSVISRTSGAIRFYTEESSTSLKAESKEVGNKPLYITKDEFQKKIMEQRRQAANPEFGQRPSAWQRRFLVLTRLYKHQKDIPEIVANGTMNRMHDRMRVVFIITAVVTFFSIFYTAELINANKIDHDRNAGVVVTKM